MGEDDRNDEKRRERMRARALQKPHIQKMRQAQLDGGALQSSTTRVALDRDGDGGHDKTKRDTTQDEARRHRPAVTGPATLHRAAAQSRQSSSLHRPGKTSSLKRTVPDEFIPRRESAKKRRADIVVEIAAREANDSDGDFVVTPSRKPPHEVPRSSGRTGGSSESALHTHGRGTDREPVLISDGSSTASSPAASPTPSGASRETRFWSVDRAESPSPEDELDRSEQGPVEEEPPSDHESEQGLFRHEPLETEPRSGHESEQELFDHNSFSVHESDGAPASAVPADFSTATFSAPASDDSIFDSEADEQSPPPPSPSPVIVARNDSPSAADLTRLSLPISPVGSRPASAGGESISGVSLNSSTVEPSAACRTDGSLGRYLHAIREQDKTEGGDEYLQAQGKVYDKVIRDFFEVECDCPHPCERDEPENTHTVQERVTQLQQSLPPLSKIFGENGSYDPSAYFPKWKSFLSHQPVEPVSLRRTQEALHRPITVERQYDIDSFWLGATDLAAIRAPNTFRLTLLPHFSHNMTREQVIQPHGLDLANTRHILLGSFNTLSVHFTVHLLFPGSMKSGGRSNALSLDRQRDLYDDIILPAVHEAVRDPARQEIPKTFDMAYAKSRSYQEKPGTGRWRAEDESRAYQLSYDIPAEDLPLFWQLIVAKANQLRIQTRRGEPAAYFKNPQLLMQAHDLKNTFKADSLNEVFSLFEWTTLAHIDPEKVDMRSCWIDVGVRDFVANLSSRELRRSEEYTLLWKSACNARLYDRLKDAAPDSSLTATHYRSFLLRDAGNLTATVKPTKTPNVGHPASRKTGIARAKAYASNKELFSVVFSNYRNFSSTLFPLLALDEGLIRDLATLTKERERSRPALQKAWEANKRHLYSISGPKTLANYGLRKEVTLRLDAVLAMWSRGAFDPDKNPHTGPMSRVVGTQSEAGQPHYPFWIVPTRDFNALIFTQAARLVVPLDHLFKQASSGPSSPRKPDEGSIRRVLAYYTAQLFCRLLVHSLSSQREVNYDDWIWRSRWRAQVARRTFYERRGLGLATPIDASGMLWIPRSLFDWQHGHIALETLVGLYMSRSPLQTHLASQTNIQALTTSQVTVEFFLKEWIRDAQQAFKGGRKKEGLAIADRIMRLCAEEIARAYNQNLLAKMEEFWERVRELADPDVVPPLALLEKAQKDAAAEVSRIVTAQTVWEIYREAWPAYTTAMQLDVGDVGFDGLPGELPCWMITRKHSPPNDGWSEFVFSRIFHWDKPPKWDRRWFLQVYRGLKAQWSVLSTTPAGQFDNRLKRIIGRYIMVTFNSDVGGEDSHDLRLYDACAGRHMPDGLSGDAAPRVLTAKGFQNLERLLRKDWLYVMGPAIKKAPEEERNSACSQALRHIALLAGPNWASDKRMEHVVPWCRGKDDFFRHPLPSTHRCVQERSDDLLSKPTIVLPSRHNVMKLVARVRSFRGRSPELERRLQWTTRLLNNGGKQYDMLTHLDAKKKAAEVTRQSPSLLRQFLSQSEPPQEPVPSGEVDEEETASESGGCGSVTDEEERDMSEELGSLVYDSAVEP
ncbi:hypothetical protein PLIIFM63780_010559 [Purpureocillium lilacinum]|nr:hypothetical protein PLIIFM63780_010559 [Purpureocillium lilacinum]